MHTLQCSLKMNNFHILISLVLILTEYITAFVDLMSFVEKNQYDFIL